MSTAKIKPLKPKKDYFGWFYHKRSKRNKLLLHLYTWGFLLVPIFYGLSQHPLLEEEIFTEVGILFLFFLVFYCYGFAIHNFPLENKKATKMIISLLAPLAFIFVTAGSVSLHQTIIIDGSILLTSIILLTAFHIISHVDQLGKLKNDLRIYAFLGLLILVSMSSLYEIFRLFVTTQNGLMLGLNILSLFVSLIATIHIHYHYSRMIEPIRIWTTKDKEQTFEVGATLAKKATPGEIILLYGEMGAGKTTLVKGMAPVFGITSEITSPTFTLMNVYPVQNSNSQIKNFVHVDTYRLTDEKALLDIGIQDYLGASDTVCLIEWPEKVEGLLQGKKVTKIYLEHVNETTRKIVVENG